MVVADNNFLVIGWMFMIWDVEADGYEPNGTTYSAKEHFVIPETPQLLRLFHGTGYGQDGPPLGFHIAPSPYTFAPR